MKHLYDATRSKCHGCVSQRWVVEKYRVQDHVLKHNPQKFRSFPSKPAVVSLFLDCFLSRETFQCCVWIWSNVGLTSMTATMLSGAVAAAHQKSASNLRKDLCMYDDWNRWQCSIQIRGSAIKTTYSFEWLRNETGTPKVAISQNDREIRGLGWKSGPVFEVSLIKSRLQHTHQCIIPSHTLLRVKFWSRLWSMVRQHFVCRCSNASLGENPGLYAQTRVWFARLVSPWWYVLAQICVGDSQKQIYTPGCEGSGRVEKTWLWGKLGRKSGLCIIKLR